MTVAIFFLLASSCHHHVTSAQIVPVGKVRTATMLQYEGARSVRRYTFRPTSKETCYTAYIETRSKHIISSNYVTFHKMQTGTYEITTLLNFAGFPGLAKYRVKVHCHTANDEPLEIIQNEEHEVFGYALFEGTFQKPIIRSNRYAKPLIFSDGMNPSLQSRKLKAMIYPRGIRVNRDHIRMSPALQVQPLTLSKSSVRFRNGTMIVRPLVYPARDIESLIHFRIPELRLAKLVFETILHVKVLKSTHPLPHKTDLVPLMFNATAGSVSNGTGNPECVEVGNPDGHCGNDGNDGNDENGGDGVFMVAMIVLLVIGFVGLLSVALCGFWNESPESLSEFHGVRTSGMFRDSWRNQVEIIRWPGEPRT